MALWQRRRSIEPYSERKPWRGHEHEKEEGEAELSARRIGNGGAVEEHDAGGCCGGAWWWRKPLGLLLLLLSKERKWEEAAEADTRAEGVGGRGGTQGPPDGQVSPSPAHGVHAVAHVYRGRALACKRGRWGAGQAAMG
jgi:hypothetical protein